MRVGQYDTNTQHFPIITVSRMVIQNLGTVSQGGGTSSRGNGIELSPQGLQNFSRDNTTMDQKGCRKPPKTFIFMAVNVE
jgi:hypothetical protein